MKESLLKPKWRPALWMVVFGVFMLVALLPLVGMLVLIGVEYTTGFSFKLRSVGGLLTLALGSMAMAGVIGAVFLRTLLKPLQLLIARTEEIEGGEADAFRLLDTGGTQEVAALGERFFRLARRLSDRSNYLSLFTTHVSHELKTPLTSIQGAAELLRDSNDTMKPEQRQRFLQNIVEDTARLTALSTRLRELARAEVADTEGKSDLVSIINHCANEARLSVEIEGNERPQVSISKNNARIIWKQLADNAAQHKAKVLFVSIIKSDGDLKILVGDDGAKISPANKKQMFEAFFTTRREQGGTGMGLGIAQAMLRSHEGSLRVCERDDYKFEMVMVE